MECSTAAQETNWFRPNLVERLDHCIQMSHCLYHSWCLAGSRSVIGEQYAQKFSLCLVWLQRNRLRRLLAGIHGTVKTWRGLFSGDQMRRPDKARSQASASTCVFCTCNTTCRHGGSCKRFLVTASSTERRMSQRRGPILTYLTHATRVDTWDTV